MFDCPPPRERDVPPGCGSPPPPVDLDSLLDVDEGPMRGDLRRQIAFLERELTVLGSLVAPWEPRRTSPMRGPAILSTADLERVRDELVRAVRELHTRRARLR